MTSYGFVVCAAVYDWLGIGLIGHRGRIILTLIGAALVAAWWTGPLGWLGLGLGVATVIGVRRGGEWLRHEGGGQVVAAVALEVATGLARLAGDMVRRASEVFSPAPREAVPDPVPDTGPVVPRHRGTTEATPDMMRWTPGWAPLVTPGTAPEEVPEVETYSDWLPAAVERYEGANAAARAALDRWGVSRRKFYRDLAALRGEVA